MNEHEQQTRSVGSQNQIARLRSRVMQVGCWAAVLCLFFIPINKPLVNLCMAIALVATLIGQDLVRRVRLALTHPVALGALLWWGVLAGSGLFAPQSMQLWRSWLGMLAFSYPVLIISLIGLDNRWRLRAWWSFSVAMALVVLISCSQFFGVIPQRYLPDGADIMRNVVFKDYTQQGLATLCLASVLFALAIWRRYERSTKYLWVGIAVCLLSVVFAIESRTAWVCTIALTFLWCILLFFKGSLGKKLAWAILLNVAFGLSLAWWYAEQNESRITKIEQEIRAGTTQKEANSASIRLELWRQSLAVIQKSPLIGHGFDQWHAKYLEQTRDIPDYDQYRMRFPHQEFLLITAEQGFLGLGIYVGLLLALAFYMRRLAQPYRSFYAALLLLYVVAGMVNSLLADFSHRHLLLVWLGFMPWASIGLPIKHKVSQTV